MENTWLSVSFTYQAKNINGQWTRTMSIQIIHMYKDVQIINIFALIIYSNIGGRDSNPEDY